MENVKNENAKKNGIIKWVAIAACLVIVVGAIIFVPNLIGDKTAPEASADGTVEENASDVLADAEDTTEAPADTTANAEDHLASEKCDPILVGYEKVAEELSEDIGVSKGARAVMVLNKHKFVLHEGHEMNWYAFYNGCIDGTVGNDKAAILEYAKNALEQFEKINLTEEAAQAKAIVDALEGNAN